MKRKQFYLAMLAVVAALNMTVTSVAAPVTADKALCNAREFLSHTGKRNVKGERLLSLVFTIDRRVDNETRSMLYAFQIEGGGWVVASGDDAARPILAYGDDTVSVSIPDNMRAWLETYADEIAWGQKVGWQAPEASREEKVQINDLVSCQWTQNSPYNIKCKFGSTTYSTGCVATAMAQVMYYWGCLGRNGETFRHGCTALEGYTTVTKKIKISGLEALDSFDWDSMTPTTPNSNTSKDAVAWLMRYCGQSVKMDYNTSGSGALMSLVPDALKNNFGYDSGARLVKRGYMTSTQWTDMIYSELAEGRPVIMGGDGSNGGHTFICTGYQSSTGMFWMNWGWNQYNGWFELSALTPNPNDVNRYGSFNSNVEAIVGIQPPTGNTEVEDYDMLSVTGIKLTSPRVLSRQARAYDSEGKVSLMCAVTPNFVRNYEMDEDGWKTVNYDYACGVYDSEGHLMKVDGEDNLTFSQGIACLSFSFTLGGEWPYGTYTIVPLCRLNSDDEWLPMYHGDTFYVKAEVEEETITLTPSVDIKVNSFTSKKSGSKYVNTISYTNEGCEQLCGTYYVFVAGTLDKKVELTTEPGATGTIRLANTTQIKNTKLVTLCRDDFQRMMYWTNQPATSNALVDYETWVDNYTDEEKLIGDSFKARLRICNNGSVAYQHEVKASLMNYYEEEAAQTQQVNIPPYSEQILEFDFTNLSEYGYYNVTFAFPHFFWDEIESEVEGDSYSVYNGVAVVSHDRIQLYRDNELSWMDIPDDALYVDARYSGEVSSLPAGGNANTLYVLPEGVSTPTTLQGYNVVIGGQAEHISLDDAYPFLSPIDFTADEVTYTRTFTTGHHGNGDGGWSTVVLPFAVESEGVTVEGEPTPWFASANDEGRKFWLYGFKSDDNQAVTFSYVDAMEAYTPYIIAVPDNTWGRKYDLRNKEFVFTGHDASIKAGKCKAVTDRGGKYDFIGRTFAEDRFMVYSLNDDGSDFEYTIDNIETEPFRAYFAGYYGSSDDGGAVQFCFDTNSATPVTLPTIEPTTDEAIYTIEGVRCPAGMVLSKGLYIKNGKKIVVK